jgi:heat shock protein HtpX
MGLADSISRLTHLLALLGQLASAIAWSHGSQLARVALLAVAPQLALLAQLGLSACANSTPTGSLPN